MLLKRTKSIFILLVIFFTLIHVFAKTAHAKITIATGSKTGNYYPVGEQIATIINKSVQDISATVQTSHGSVENLQLLSKGEVELGIVQSDILYRSFFTNSENENNIGDSGLQILKNNKIRGIAALYPEYIQIVIKKHARIRNLLDLAGTRVYLGKQGSGTYKNAIQILNVAGLEPHDIFGITNYSTAEALEKLITGEIDAAFLTRGSIVVNETDYQNKVTLLSLRKSTLDKIIDKYPYYSQTTIEIENTTYRPRILFVRALLVARDLTNQQAYNITKALYEKWNDLFQVNAKKNTYIEFFSGKSIARKIIIPLHKGSTNLYIAKGLIYTNRDYYILFFIFLFIGLIVLFRKFIGHRLEKIVANNQVLEKCLHFIDAVTSKKIAMVIWAIAFIFSMDILLIKRMEASYSFLHDIPTPFEDLSFGDTLLWLLTYASTGYTQGIFPVSNAGKVLSIIIPFLGVGGILFGIIMFANKQFQTKDLERRGIKVRYLKDHIIICGWNTRVPGIIKDLTSPYVPYKRKIVIIAEMDEEYPLQEYNFDPKFVFYCKGYSSSYETLQKVHLKNAHKVIVMAGQKKIANENIRSILTVMAIKDCYRKSISESKRNISISKEISKRVTCTFRQKNSCKNTPTQKGIPIFAELFFERNRDYFELAETDKLISLDLIRTKFCVAASMNKGVTDLLLDLLMHNEGDDLYSIEVNDLPSNVKENILGKTFSEILVYLRTRKALLLSIHRNINPNNNKNKDDTFTKDNTYIINPNDSESQYRIDLNDKLIYIADNKFTIMQENNK